MGIPISGMLPVYLESRHELIGFLDAPGAVCGEATITVRGDGRDIVLGVLRFVRERTGGDVLQRILICKDTDRDELFANNFVVAPAAAQCDLINTRRE
jgi:hypothetical protein